MVQAAKRLRCAIYTRKSSEEGLEQSFNSLDAQREACVAYVQSQRHEGWRVLDSTYDDGGYSGGSLDRPAVQKLLADIRARQVDAVVVYKVDRLTRSLADFAKIVELFDAHGVSFVSVTQQFNTTSSMGRLTLNVLLSFAQFEREVTGERIRDKIAASKKKGMWMGGYVPLGYDLQDRKLVPNSAEAQIIQTIFRRYLALGCVRKLQFHLTAKKILSKQRINPAGRKTGGQSYSRGALYSILQNRLYIGEIAHRGAIYAGEHAALIDRSLWDKVQAQLTANGRARRFGVKAAEPSMLAGLAFDVHGHRFTPLHATKGSKRYRYYVSQQVIRNSRGVNGSIQRIPAHELEDVIRKRLARLFLSPPDILAATARADDDVSTQKAILRGAKDAAKIVARGPGTEVKELLYDIQCRITVRDTTIDIRCSPACMRARLLNKLEGARSNVPASDASAEDALVITAETCFARRGGEVHLIRPSAEADRDSPVDEVLVKAVARARRWYRMLVTGEAPSIHAIGKATGLNDSYVTRVMRAAFLAPDIIEAVLSGKHSRTLTLDQLIRDIPTDWKQQRERFAGTNGR